MHLLFCFTSLPSSDEYANKIKSIAKIKSTAQATLNLLSNSGHYKEENEAKRRKLVQVEAPNFEPRWFGSSITIVNRYVWLYRAAMVYTITMFLKSLPEKGGR